MHLCGSLPRLAITLLVATAASISRRDPSQLINLRHSEPRLSISPDTHESNIPETDNTPNLITARDTSSSSPDQTNQKQAKNLNKLTISGHGVVAVPITPEGKYINVEIESGSHIIDNNDDTTTDSKADSGEYIHHVQVGSTTFQVIGPNLTITDDRHHEEDPSPNGGPGAIPGDEINHGGGGGAQGGLDDENSVKKLSPGQLAAMAFAKAAEQIMADNQQE